MVNEGNGRVVTVMYNVCSNMRNKTSFIRYISIFTESLTSKDIQEFMYK